MPCLWPSWWHGAFVSLYEKSKGYSLYIDAMAPAPRIWKLLCFDGSNTISYYSAKKIQSNTMHCNAKGYLTIHLESENFYALMEAILYHTIVQRKYKVIQCIAMQKDIWQYIFARIIFFSGGSINMS